MYKILWEEKRNLMLISFAASIVLLVLAEIFIGDLWNKRFSAVRNITDILVSFLVIAGIICVSVSVFRKGTGVIEGILRSAASALFSIFIGMLNGNTVTIALALVWAFLCFFIMGLLFAIAAILFPITTIYYFIRSKLET